MLMGNLPSVHIVRSGRGVKSPLKERNQVEELVAKIADEDANEARARAEKQME